MGCGCGCSPSALELAANPAAAKLAGLVPGAGIGGAFPTITTAGAVQTLKERINPSMVATDNGVRACTTLDAPSRTSWDAFYASWRSFYETPEPTFGSANRWDNALAFQAQLAGWQEVLRAKCTIPGPVVQVEDAPPDLSVVKWAAAAVIAVAVVYGARLVLK